MRSEEKWKPFLGSLIRESTESPRPVRILTGEIDFVSWYISRMVNSFLLSMILVTGLWVQAAPQGKPGTHWPTIIAGLESSGIHKVGDFEVKAFREEANQIHWRGLSGAPEAVLSGSRQSAFYLWDQRQVYLSEQLPAEALAALPQLELHEALGATGYNDHDYSLSTALVTLSKLDPTAQRQKLLNAYGKSLFTSSKMTDGGTSVSGGGDLTTLYVKSQVLKNIMAGAQNSSAVSDDFLLRFPSINFEPLETAGLTKVYIKYQYIVHPKASGSRELFSVYVPVQRWRQGADAQKSLIREIERKLGEIFPARRGENLRRFQPEGCTSSEQTVTYPATEDPAVRSIQNFRGSLQLGCFKIMPGLTDVAVIAPALPLTSLPEDAGSYYFNCVFRYGSTSSFVYTQTAKPGQNMLGSKQWSLVDDDYVGGLVWISEGKILKTGIRYVPPQNTQGYIPPTVSLSQNPDRGRAQMTVNGQPLSFECRKAQ